MTREMDVDAELLVDPAAADALARAQVGDPFALLGPHPAGTDCIVRTYLPNALSVEALDRRSGKSLGALSAVQIPGLFAGRIPAKTPYTLRIRWPAGEQETEDPYSFGLLLGEVDLYLFSEGNHRELGGLLGAKAMALDGVKGVRFSVWAPNARRVSVVGGFNGWDGRRNPMRLRISAGLWELFVPRLAPGEAYKFEILGPQGVLPLKADPMALATEAPPRTASVVADPTPYRWTDTAWVQARPGRQSSAAPMSIYEMHAGSWMRDGGDDGRVFTWKDLTQHLIPYVKKLGFTHIELMPIMEHPFGGSWGYQALSQFAPSARYGSPAEFAGFVDACHAAGVGVILDWVPAHFPTDEHGLAHFDGTALYEHANPFEGFHQDWNTLIYNLGRREVHGFMLASALFWLEHFHVDGLRVDAVASMLYRDYSRKQGEWVPNRFGGRENLESIDFLRHLNDVVNERVPGAMVIAEESTAWPGVTHPTQEGGLGFSFKWNMGWMHDTLHYATVDPVYRSYDHGDITFGLVYAFSEKFVLPISHDEVVHGKGSLINKMPGDAWQKFANLRAYLSLMWMHPGKKLLFMGSEFGQFREWSHDRELDWFLLSQAPHQGVQNLMRDLNGAYVAHAALHTGDCTSAGFQWVIGNDSGNSVFAWLRLAPGQPTALVVCNMTPVPREGYQIGVPQSGHWREVLNSDAGDYGGSGVGNLGGVATTAVPAHGRPQSVLLTLPPLGVVALLAPGGSSA